MTTKNQFTAIYKKTKNWFVAWVEEIPGVNTQGKTLKEARENLHEALTLTIETNRILSRSRLSKKQSSRREVLSITLTA
jgi:predicted RNase H-like HicB family nuclease